jgi:hypothetical protein
VKLTLNGDSSNPITETCGARPRVRPPRESAAPHSFGLGETELGINTLDADGVAFAAIQGLNAKLEAERAAKEGKIAVLRAELAELRDVRAELAAIRSVLATIAGALPPQTAVVAP